jgi:hypothetical protein
MERKQKTNFYAGTTGKLDRPESWNDRKAGTTGMTGTIRNTGLIAAAFILYQ